MKKNAMLKIAAILLVAVLLTTCAISATFAKYQTTDTLGTQSARVAKWGVTINSTAVTDSTGLFDTNYSSGPSSDSKGNVISSDTDFVVAPGTNGSVTISNVATGTPEVSGKIVVTADVTFNGNWVGADGTTVYCPLVFKVNNGTDIKIDATNTTTAKLADAIEAAVVAVGTSYFEANEAVTMDTSVVLSWDWALGNASADDTALGDAATAPSITIVMSATVEQTGAAGVANTANNS